MNQASLSPCFKKCRLSTFNELRQLAPFVYAMFATGHDEANSAVFRAQPADDLDLVGIALRSEKGGGQGGQGVAASLMLSLSLSDAGRAGAPSR